MSDFRDARETPCDGFIILLDDGKEWTNQTGGYACHHPVELGLFSPFMVDAEFWEALDEIFDKKYNGWCCTGRSSSLTEEDADYLDGVFEIRGLPVRMNLERLHQSEEAWLYVWICEEEAVFTFGNSD